MTYHERCKLLNRNPVLVARHFQYRVENFFKDIIIDGPLGKTQYYAIRVEFQVRGSPHVHAFLWTKNVPALTDEDKESYIRHVDQNVSAVLPDKNENEIFELVKTYQIHRHSKTCRKYRNTRCRFNFGKYFCERTIIAEPLSRDISPVEKSSLLAWRKGILEKVKAYIDTELNPAKKNFFDENAENYEATKSTDEIFDFLNIKKEDYYKALSVSDDDDFQIHLRRTPNSCFVNNYFCYGLLAWEANIDIQPVFNYYKAVTYMCAYLSKSEDECSQAMNQAAKEAYENNLDTYEKMKAISKAYVTKREVSVQEAVYLVMPELWLRKVFPGVLFANSNIPDKRYRICLSEEEIKKLPEDSTEIFKRNMIDRYCARPNLNFANGKYGVLDGLCFAQFLRYYTLRYGNKDNDCQPDELEDELIEINHKSIEYPKLIPLMDSNEKLKCRKVPLVLRYYEPNKVKHPEDYAHLLLFLYYPFRSENDFLVNSETYVEKLHEPCILDIINRNKTLIEPFSEIVDQAFEQFLNTNLSAPDAFSQQENEEVQEQVENLDEDEGDEELQSKSVNIGISIASTLLTDDDINARIRSLNSQQKEIFEFVQNWSRNFVKNLTCKVPTEIEPFYLFLTGGGGVGKSHLLTTIYNAVSKELIYKGNEPSKSRILVLAPTGVAAVNVNGTTIHSGLNIPTRGKLFPLNDKSRTTLRLKLSCVELIMIDEISMVPNKLFKEIDLRLREIFSCDIPFGGKSVILCGDLYQLPPVNGKPVYMHDSSYIQGILGLELWRKFSIAELTEVMRQRGDFQFIDLLNQVRIGELNEQNVNLLKSRFILKDSARYPVQAIHIFAENAPANQHNQQMLEQLDTPLVQILAIDEFPREAEISNIDLTWIKNAKLSETGGLTYNLEIKVGARVMITRNIDISDKLINGQVGTVSFIKLRASTVVAIYVKLDDDSAGIKSKQTDLMTRQNNLIVIERAEANFNTKKRISKSPCIRRTQFPLMLSWACTCHKVQGLSITSAVISFELLRQWQFNVGQMYVALSRVTTINGLFLIGEYSHKAIKVNKNANTEYERLRNENAFKPIADVEMKLNSVTITLLNIRSFSKHAIDIAADKQLCNSDIIFLTETQLLPENDTSNVENNLKDFFIGYNHCAFHKFKSLAICFQHEILILAEHVKFPGVSVVSFLKSNFSSTCFTVLLIYRQPGHIMQSFYNNLTGILQNRKIDIVLGDFNIDAFDPVYENLRILMANFRLVVDKPTHLSGGLLDHIYIRKDFLIGKYFNVNVKNVFFSDHDAVRLNIANS